MGLQILAKGKKDSLKNRLVKGAAGLFGLKVAATGLTAVTGVILARLLGADGLGIYAYVSTWTNLLIILSTLGLNKLFVREIAIYQSQSAWGLMRGLLRWANQVVLLVSTGLALVAISVAWLLRAGSDSQMLLALCIALAGLPIKSLRSLRLAAMQGLDRVVLGNLPELLVAPLLLIALIGCGYLLLGNDFNVFWVLGINLVVITITFMMGALLLRRELSQKVKRVAPEYQVRNWLHSAFPFIFLGGLYLINAKTDILMLGAIKGPEAVGIYVAVSQLSSITSFIYNAVNSVLAPTIARFYGEGNLNQLQRVVNKSTRLVFLISLLISIILIGFGYWFLLLFGPDFTRGENVLRILLIGQLVHVATGPVGWLLNMTRNENYTLMTSGSGVLLNVILNALLIPQWGIEGAATATVSSLILVNIMNTIWVHKKLRISMFAWMKLNFRN